MKYKLNFFLDMGIAQWHNNDGEDKTNMDPEMTALDQETERSRREADVYCFLCAGADGNLALRWKQNRSLMPFITRMFAVHAGADGNDGISRNFSKVLRRVALQKITPLQAIYFGITYLRGVAAFGPVLVSSKVYPNVNMSDKQFTAVPSARESNVTHPGLQFHPVLMRFVTLLRFLAHEGFIQQSCYSSS